MSSLRRLPNSQFWIACFRLPNGTRTNRSTKTTDRRLAQRLADEWQTAADEARERRLVEAQARNVLSDILAHVGEESLSGDSVESFLRQWLPSKTGNTAKRYAATVEKFLQSLAAKRSAIIATIGHREILSFFKSREEAGVAAKTLHVDARTLHAAFNLARKLGLITNNPVERALAIRPIAVQSNRRGCFSPGQVKSLIDAATGDWKTLILLGYFTGARLSDCAGMRWQDVNFVHGVIDYIPQKTHRKSKRVVVPIHPTLLAHLENLASPDRPGGFLCPNLAGKGTGGKNGLSGQFKRLMACVGVDVQATSPNSVRRLARLSFHSLRHSFNSAMANAGVDQETRMRLTGHSSISVNNGYTHLELPQLRIAVEKLPRFA
jgi:integrase